jgi:hypothetical protein
MKNLISAIAIAMSFCALHVDEVKAQNAFGHSGIVYDSVNRVVRGYSRTELDYNTAAYYTPYVCGSLSANGVEKTRSCQGGLLSATVNTQFTGAPDNAALTSDHYVDMVFYDEEVSSYEDYYGYSFLPGYTYPLDVYFSAPDIFTHRQPVSIRVGATTAQAQLPQVTIVGYSFDPLHIKKAGGTAGDTTVFKVRVVAGDSEEFNHAEVTVSIAKALGSTASLTYYPAKTITVPLVRADVVEIPYTISTTADNKYVGPVQFLISIFKVVDTPTKKDISANIKIRPADGLLTNQITPPPPNILNIDP